MDFFAENYNWTPDKVLDLPSELRLFLYSRKVERIERNKPPSK